MKVINEVQPSDPKQIAAMMEDGPAGPIFMVNLLRFKDKAAYADGRQTDLSGREAYMLYAEEVAKLLKEYGGDLVFAGDVTFLALGQVEEMWHEVAIASYPNRNALFRMATSEKWQEISVHRTAGLEGQLNIETVMPPRMRSQP
ncbi:MAG: DUF1330 domain-containing protein [Pseudomonadota bacterium]